jgi:geranylgeranyl diphosphate synthase type II
MGGKRLRPVLGEIVGEAVGAAPDVILHVGVAVEYLHTASILLDDLPCMDDAKERRGQPPAHVRFSQAAAILASVALVSRGYAVLLAAPVERQELSRELVRLACETVGGAMAGGQARGLAPTSNESAAEVRLIHERKTASLFGLIGRLLTRCAKADAERASRIVRFTTLFGRAFQILDDLEDVDVPGEARANLPRVVGIRRARAETEGVVREARRTVVGLQPAHRFAACIDWLEKGLDAAA